MGFNSGFKGLNSCKEGNVSLQCQTQTIWCPHSTVSNGYQLLFPWTLCTLYKAQHLPPSGAMVNNMWTFASTHCTNLHGAELRHNDNFTMCLKYQAVKICGVFLWSFTNCHSQHQMQDGGQFIPP